MVYVLFLSIIFAVKYSSAVYPKYGKWSFWGVNPYISATS